MDMPSIMTINVWLLAPVTTNVDAGLVKVTLLSFPREINSECIQAREVLLILCHAVRDQRQQIQLMHRESCKCFTCTNATAQRFPWLQHPATDIQFPSKQSRSDVIEYLRCRYTASPRRYLLHWRLLDLRTAKSIRSELLWSEEKWKPGGENQITPAHPWSESAVCLCLCLPATSTLALAAYWIWKLIKTKKTKHHF